MLFPHYVYVRILIDPGNSKRGQEMKEAFIKEQQAQIDTENSDSTSNDLLPSVFVLNQALKDYFKEKKALEDFAHPYVQEEITNLYEMTSDILDKNILERATNIFDYKVSLSYTEIIDELVDQVNRYLKVRSLHTNQHVQERVNEVKEQMLRVADLTNKFATYEKKYPEKFNTRIREEDR